MAEIILADDPVKFTPSGTAQKVTVPNNVDVDTLWLTVEGTDPVVAWGRDGATVDSTAREQLPPGRWPIHRPASVQRDVAWSIGVVLVSGTAACYVQPVRRGS